MVGTCCCTGALFAGRCTLFLGHDPMVLMGATCATLLSCLQGGGRSSPPSSLPIGGLLGRASPIDRAHGEKGDSTVVPTPFGFSCAYLRSPSRFCAVSRRIRDAASVRIRTLIPGRSRRRRFRM